MNYLTKQLIDLSIQFAEQENIELETLSRRIFGNSNRLPDMRAEKSNPTTPIWMRGVAYISDAWPDDVEWPSGKGWIREEIIFPSQNLLVGSKEAVEDA